MVNLENTLNNLITNNFVDEEVTKLKEDKMQDSQLKVLTNSSSEEKSK